MNNLISVLLHWLMLKELSIHCIYIQHLLLLIASQTGVQFHQCICTCVIYEYDLDIHKYLQIWSHSQMDILNVKWIQEEMLMKKVMWRTWNFWSTGSQCIGWGNKSKTWRCKTLNFYFHYCFCKRNITIIFCLNIDLLKYLFPSNWLILLEISCKNC